MCVFLIFFRDSTTNMKSHVVVAILYCACTLLLVVTATHLGREGYDDLRQTLEDAFELKPRPQTRQRLLASLADKSKDKTDYGWSIFSRRSPPEGNLLPARQRFTDFADLFEHTD